MTDIISLIHKSTEFGHLFESVSTGKHNLSIQASKNHICWPREDGLKPYQYDAFEVMVYGRLRAKTYRVMNSFHVDTDLDGHMLTNLSKHALQVLYDHLCEVDQNDIQARREKGPD